MLTSYFSASSSAPNDASAIVQHLLDSLRDTSSTQSRSSQQPPPPPPQQQHQFCSLADLLTAETCIPVIQAAPSTYLDTLLTQLPPSIILLETTTTTTTTASGSASLDASTKDPTQADATAAIASMTDTTKRSVLTRVLRSPQLRQSLGSLTVAISDGGLPTVAEALAIKVENGGFVRGGSVPLGGAEAVEAFVHGVRTTVKTDEENTMDTA